VLDEAFLRLLKKIKNLKRITHLKSLKNKDKRPKLRMSILAENNQT